MAYKLLGMAVWKGGKVFLRHRYGTARPLIAASVVVASIGLLLALSRRDS